MTGLIGTAIGIGLHYLPISKREVFKIIMYFLQGGL
jgi:hypothetical protein